MHLMQCKRLKNVLCLVFLIQTDLCQLFSTALFAYILFPGFRRGTMHVCVSRSALCFCIFGSRHMILFLALPKTGDYTWNFVLVSNSNQHRFLALPLVEKVCSNRVPLVPKVEVTPRNAAGSALSWAHRGLKPWRDKWSLYSFVLARGGGGGGWKT